MGHFAVLRRRGTLQATSVALSPAAQYGAKTERLLRPTVPALSRKTGDTNFIFGSGPGHIMT